MGQRENSMSWQNDASTSLQVPKEMGLADHSALQPLWAREAREGKKGRGPVVAGIVWRPSRRNPGPVAFSVFGSASSPLTSSKPHSIFSPCFKAPPPGGYCKLPAMTSVMGIAYWEGYHSFVSCFRLRALTAAQKERVTADGTSNLASL